MTTKKCSKCSAEKLLEEFNKKSASKLHSRCKECVRESVRQHYSKNKQYYIEKAIKHNEKYRLINKQFAWDYLKEHPCIDCGESDPIVLEFDHINPLEKTVTISRLISGHPSWQKVLNEINKCRVLCANCHRRHTYYQQNSWGKTQ